MATSAQRIQFLVDQEDGFNRSRLPALYSDFRGLRTTNPEGYAANVAAWRRGLTALVRRGMLPATAPSSGRSGSGSGSGTGTHTGAAGTTSTAARNVLVLAAGPALLDALQSDRYGRPLALDAVLHEAVQARDLMPLDPFLGAAESIYGGRSWSAWAAGLPGQAVAWGVGRLLGLAVGGGALPGSRFRSSAQTQPLVVVANVEAAAAAFAAKTADARRSAFERTWSAAHFKRVFGAPGAVLDDVDGGSSTSEPVRLSDTDLEVLLTFLARDKHLVVYDGQVVKLRASSSASATDTDTDTIADEDRAVAQLRELIDSLTHQTAVLSGRVEDRAAAARAAVLRKNRVAALAALRQKKQAETVLAARFATLAQLEATAAQVEQAAGQVQVVQAMAASADALRSLHAQVGGAAGVEDVVDRLRDQMDAADEIGRILTEAGPSSTAATAAGTGTGTGTGLVLDEAEIDEELAALEKDEQERRQAADQAAHEAAQARDAEATRRRLEAAGTVPQEAAAAAAAEAALEAETTESLRNLSLGPTAQAQAEPAR